MRGSSASTDAPETNDRLPVPLTDLLPAARSPLGDARVRLRGVPVTDAVTFVAVCPGCGRDAQWQEEREDTRLRVSITCDC